MDGQVAAVDGAPASDGNNGEAIPPPNEQATDINDLLEKNDDNVIGEAWYCVDLKWWNAWKVYVNFNSVAFPERKYETKVSTDDEAKPGKITNGHLLAKNSTMRLQKQLTMEVDYKLVHETVWNKISVWYGFDTAIRRVVILRNKDRIVELYPRMFAALSSEEESATRHEFFFSESHSMSDLMDKAADVLGVADKDFRPWLRKDATDEFHFTLSENLRVRRLMLPLSTHIALATHMLTEDKGILQNEVPEIFVETPNADGEYKRPLSLKSLGVIIQISGAGSSACNGTYVPCEPFKDVSSTNPAWRRETAEETWNIRFDDMGFWAIKRGSYEVFYQADDKTQPHSRSATSYGAFFYTSQVPPKDTWYLKGGYYALAKDPAPTLEFIDNVVADNFGDWRRKLTADNAEVEGMQIDVFHDYHWQEGWIKEITEEGTLVVLTCEFKPTYAYSRKTTCSLKETEINLETDWDKLQPRFSSAFDWRSDMRVNDRVRLLPPYGQENWGMKDDDRYSYSTYVKKVAIEYYACRVEEFKDVDGVRQIRLHRDKTTRDEDQWYPLFSAQIQPIKATKRGKGGGGNKGNVEVEPLTDKSGVCGLVNLGNTCFMNSTLQCLSNCESLTMFVRDEMEEKDLNKDNPLGHGGRLAEAYKSLMLMMWSGDNNAVRPSDVKRIIGQKAPQFAGFAQQDSQELLQWLLDGLDEDLSRLKKKEPTEKVEGHGRDDEIVSKEALIEHKKRNDSVVSDLFLGQFRSQVRCCVPTCGRQSKTFDPFTIVSTPLPTVTTFLFEATLIPRGAGASPIKFKAKLRKRDAFGDLLNWTAKYFKLPRESLFAADMWLGKVHDVYSEQENLDRVGPRDITFVFQTHDPSEITDEENEAAAQARKEKIKEEALARKELIENHQPADRLEVGTQVRIISSGVLGTVQKSFAMACNVRLKKRGQYNSLEYIYYKDLEPYFWDEEEAEDAKPEPITKMSFGTQCLPARRMLVQMSVQSRPANTYANNANSKNTGVRVLDLKFGTTNKQVHQLVRTRLEKFFLPVEDNETTSDSDSNEPGEETKNTTEATTASTATAVTTVPYVIKYEDLSTYYALPNDDTEFNAEKLYVEVNRGFDLAQCIQSKDDVSVGTSAKASAITLKSCLDRFSVEEQLDKFNEWYCPGCKNHVQAYKTMDLYRLPTILVVQLKRFEYEEGTSFYGQRSTIRNKITSLVNFPIVGLDLNGIAKGPQETPPIYDLFAISNHHGGLGGGHYTAYAKNFHNGKWYNFNDSMVSEIGTSQLVTPAAYVLFYRRRDAEDASGGAAKAESPAESSASAAEAAPTAESPAEAAASADAGET